MGCHVLESNNNTDCDTDDERKSDKEFSSNDEESISEVLRISSCVGGKVGCLKKKLIVLDINGLLVDLVYPPPNDQKPDTIIRGVAGGGGDLREYIDGLVNVENVPKYVEERPFGQEPITKTSKSWNFYIKIIDTLSAC
ncbi:hypothetical protein PIB30_059179 [Stylosanthes scabra]|uniref:FCP1 homology domain-containing protein n=1 Tax=Stylosanthes scabra TaxID=79078 RepID=A0ABU6TMA5_9FABA|nr:hypothetical protein [Stylosanthes scabra]